MINHRGTEGTEFKKYSSVFSRRLVAALIVIPEITQ